MASKYLYLHEGGDEAAGELLCQVRSSTVALDDADVETQERVLEMVNLGDSPRSTSQDEPDIGSSPSTTRLRLAADRAARRASQTASSSETRSGGAAEEEEEVDEVFLESAEELQPPILLQIQSHVKPRVRSVALRSRTRKPRTSSDEASDQSAIEMMASQPAARSSPLKSPSGSPSVSRLRERKAALVNEEEDRAKSTFESFSLDAPDSALASSPVDSSDNALRLLSSGIDPFLSSGPGENDSETSQEAIAQRKAKYKAKLAQRVAQEAAAADAGGEKSEAGGLLSATPSSEPSGGDVPVTVPPLTALVARMQRRQRSGASGPLGTHVDSTPGSLSLPRQPAQRTPALGDVTSLDDLSGNTVASL
jgi:hypothetical protein